MFASYATVRPIKHLDDFEISEIDSVWYNEDELREIRSTCQKLIDRIRSSLFDNDDSHRSFGLARCSSVRGLERHVHRSNDRRRSIRAVLIEQDSQLCNGSLGNDASIAAVYRRHTRRSQRIAHEKALRDEKQAAYLDKVCDCAESSTKCPLKFLQPTRMERADEIVDVSLHKKSP